ncbi:MAG: tetratricopeptide repeat protein [Rhodothermales bacterium]
MDPRAQDLLIKGQRAFQQGNYEGAMALLDSAETYAPGAPVIPFNRGRVYTAVNRIDAARKAFHEAIERDPAYPEARLRLGDIELQRGDVEAALKYYREEQSVEPSSDLFVKMGESFYRMGEADSARAAYEQAIALDSTNATAHMMYGQLLEETGQLEEALRHSQRALALEPNQSNYQYAVGSQLYQMGRLEESVEYLKRAADGRLLHYPAQNNLAQVLLRLGREGESDYYMARADSSRELMNRITDAQSIAAQNPTSVDGWIKLGELFRMADERDRAMQAFNRAAILEPTNLRVQKIVGEMMLAEGDVQTAIDLFQAILQVDRSRVDVWKNLALAYAAAGQCEDARRALSTAREHRPGDASLANIMNGLCQELDT